MSSLTLTISHLDRLFTHLDNLDTSINTDLLMVTRGLIGFIIGGVRKATYNHYDSYLSGLRNDIIHFILSLTEEEIVDMQAKVEAVSIYPQAERSLMAVDVGAGSPTLGTADHTPR